MHPASCANKGMKMPLKSGEARRKMLKTIVCAVFLFINTPLRNRKAQLTL
jgi:hypothetical protein